MDAGYRAGINAISDAFTDIRHNGMGHSVLSRKSAELGLNWLFL